MYDSFKSNIDKIVMQYEHLQAENNELKNQIKVLQSQIATLQNSTNYSNKQNQFFPPLQFQETNRYLKKLKNKKKIKTDWSIMQYDFSDSIMCVNRLENIITFGCADSSIVLFNSTNLNKIGYYNGHRGAINAVVSDIKTGLFASCSGDGTAHIWSLRMNDSKYSGQRKSIMEAEEISTNLILSNDNKPVLCGAWIDGAKLITGNSGSKLCIWDAVHSQNAIHVENLNSSVLCLSSPRDNNYFNFAAGLSSGEILFFDLRTEKSIFSLSHSKGQIINCSFVNDSYPHFISAGTDKSLRDWDLRSISENKRSYDIDHVPTKIDVVGQYVAIPTETGRVRFVNLSQQTISPLSEAPFSYTISSCSFLNNDGTKLLCGSWDGTAAIAQLSNN